MKKAKKLAVVLLMLCAMLALSVNVSAAKKTSAAAKQKAAITKVVNKFYKAQKAYKYGTMNKMLLNKDLTFVSQGSYAKKYAKKSSFKVTSVKLNGDMATARVKCTYYDASKYFKKVFKDAYPAGGVTSSYALTAWESRAINLFNYTYKYNRKTPPKKTKTISVPLVKVGSSWKIESATQSMYNVYTMGYLNSMLGVMKAHGDLS